MFFSFLARIGCGKRTYKLTGTEAAQAEFVAEPSGAVLTVSLLKPATVSAWGEGGAVALARQAGLWNVSISGKPG